uniref:Uncharacterized protein n=1 Tax=Arundo donax TaxID=35708 RepID=A0A0A9C748_ARUDO
MSSKDLTKVLKTSTSRS